MDLLERTERAVITTWAGWLKAAVAASQKAEAIKADQKRAEQARSKQ